MLSGRDAAATPLAAWRSVVVNSELGDAVGQRYTHNDTFPRRTRRNAEALVAHIIADYRERLRTLRGWRSATKAEAIAKLNASTWASATRKAGMSYSGYEVKPDDIVGNLRRGRLVRLPLLR